MNRVRTGPLPVAHLRDALRSDLDALPDAELLDRFARYADHPAFEVLLRRHGPMVFGVCRRTLTNPADAEDAFQATFLVFIRKARLLRRADRLGPWLYGVACRVAMKARARAARLAEYRTEVREMIPDFNVPAAVPDWLPVLDTELAALPAKYRDALVMCELEGASRADAAKVLGVPEGTLSSRLARGRELLRRRLLKHGTFLPAAGLMSLFTANGVGRATVPGTLLTKASELAKVATGGAAAGTVPVGTAQLTDEVLKSMFLTKLRTTGGALVALVLVVVGVAAARLPGAPGAPPDEKSAAKAPDKPAASQPPAPKRADREALQGLWAIDKVAFVGEKVSDHTRQELTEIFKHLQVLISGDSWWFLTGLRENGVWLQTATIDPQKNPKWLDLGAEGARLDPPVRYIYQLDGDMLRLCGVAEQMHTRPAEFAADTDTGLVVMTFRRAKMQPATGETALVGSWVSNKVEVADQTAGKPAPDRRRRLEILDGYLFARAPGAQERGEWFGGRYTVDATKNPKWIDVELVTAKDDKVPKFYGCYEVTNEGVKLALGTNGKRAVRPLELKAAPDVLFFDVKATKEPLQAPTSAPEKAITAPVPRVKSRVLEEDERIETLMSARDFAGAENFIRKRLGDYKGLELAVRSLQLGICLTQRAANSDASMVITLRTEAAGRFREAITEVEAYQKGSGTDKRAVFVRTQAELHFLSVLQQAGKSDEVIAAAVPLLERHKGTVEELIILSLVYHAHSKRGNTTQVQKTCDQMKSAFEKLRDKLGAFSASSGEYSREYWEKFWFAEK